jgi:hypothetical protein
MYGVSGKFYDSHMKPTASILWNVSSHNNWPEKFYRGNKELIIIIIISRLFQKERSVSLVSVKCGLSLEQMDNSQLHL